jgi:uncharacterized membrane protein YoaT (DUF817 family)
MDLFPNKAPSSWHAFLSDFFLASIFIWFAENIRTFTNGWIYPNQMKGWHMVSIGKFVSWCMLMIISYVMVSFVNRPTDFQNHLAARSTRRSHAKTRAMKQSTGK